MPFGLFGERMPYTNFHRLNLDWIIRQVKELGHDVAEYKEQLDAMGVSIEEFRNYIENIDSEIEQKIEEEVPAYIQDAIDHGLLTQLVAATRTRRVVIIGDSYGAGWTPDGDVTGFPIVIKNLLHLSDSNFFTNNKGGARFGAAAGNEFAFDTVLNQLLPNISDKDTITDIIFAGGYNEGASSYDTINEGIARCKSIIGLNFHNPSLRTHLFAIGYHCSNPQQRTLLYNRYQFCYSRSGFAYTHLTPAICLSDWWASDGYHPLQPAQNVIAQNIIGVMMGGTDIGVPIITEYAPTNVNNITLFTRAGNAAFESLLYGQTIPFETAITLNRNQPVKILTITSKLPICNISDMSIIKKMQICAVIGMAGHYETHTLTLYLIQSARNTFELYATILATNAAGNGYLELTGVSSIEFISNSFNFSTPYEF